MDYNSGIEVLRMKGDVGSIEAEHEMEAFAGEERVVDVVTVKDIPGERSILESWKRHFTERGVAWIVAREPNGYLKLWKRLEVEY